LISGDAPLKPQASLDVQEEETMTGETEKESFQESAHR